MRDVAVASQLLSEISDDLLVPNRQFFGIAQKTAGLYPNFRKHLHRSTFYS